MKVIHVSLAASGGAGAAASRLNRALRAADCDSRLATVFSADRDDFGMQLSLPAFRWRVRLDRWSLLRYRRRDIFAWWSNNHLPTSIARQVCAAAPDIVHLHWIGDDLLPPRALGEFGCPVVWTLHDMWPFTGGCHYANDCANFTVACGRCPQLGSGNPADLSHHNLTAKLEAWAGLPLAIVCPSHWMADCARRSRVLANRPIVALPNAIPIDLFIPRDRPTARARLGIKGRELVVVAGSAGGISDRRKGLPLLLESAAELSRLYRDRPVRLMLFGPDDGQTMWSSGFTVQSVGDIASETELSWLFAAADVVAVPSLQDNLPNIAIEAISCGIPVVGFASGGLPEVVADANLGRISTEFSSSALAHAIDACVGHHIAHPQASQACRKFAEDNYAPSRVAQDHLEFYAEFLRTNSVALSRQATMRP